MDSFQGQKQIDEQETESAREEASPRKPDSSELSLVPAILIPDERYTCLSSIEQEPPKSLQIIHKALKQAVHDLEVELTEVESDFYEGNGLVEEIAKWKFVVNKVLKSAGFTDIWSNKQVDELERMSVSSTSHNVTGRVVASEVKKIRECIQRIREFLPTRFQNIVKQMKRILNLFDTYCKSFYDETQDPFVDTASNYERSRHLWIKRVQKTRDLIPDLLPHFDSEKGISVTKFSSTTKEMAQQLGASNIHFLFLVPEACQSVRQAIADFREWLATDASYSEYVCNDLEELSSRLVRSARILREAQQRSYKQNFKLRQAEAEWSRLNDRVQELSEKEDSLIVEEESLAQLITDCDTDVNVKHFQQEQLRKRVGQMHPEVYRETLERLANELKGIEVELPRSKRRIQQVRAKLYWVKQKRARLAELERAQLDAKTIRDEADQQREEVQVEHDNLVNCVRTLKRIYRFKSTSDALQRLHYQLPLTVNRDGERTQSGEKAAPLIRACEIISEEIERDWVRLYQILPFIPTRGRATVEADILKVHELAGRQGYETQSYMSLARWRRHHKRAKVSDLLTSLRRIGRSDVARLVHEDLYPKPVKHESVLEETKKPPVSAELLPYYRMIERFDLLRAQGKI